MDLILTQIERALEKKLHYLAVTSALTLPDICSALETDDGTTKPLLSQAWFDQWKQHGYGERITGEQLYMLRCGILHQGRLRHPKMEYNRIVFMVNPGWHLNLSIQGEVKVLQLDASMFCRDMMTSVRSWYGDKKDDSNVKKWLPFVLAFRPKGLPPHFVNIPLIG